MSYTKTISKQIAFVVTFFLATLLISWNNIESSRTEVSGGTGTNSQYAELKDFPVLRIGRALIDEFFKNTEGKKVHKMVFKFNIDNKPQSLNPSLVVFRAKKNGRKYIPGTLKIVEGIGQICEIKDEYTLGNLEIHKNEWRTLLGKAGDTDTYLYFYPKRVQQNGVYNIIYLLYWGDGAPPIEDCSKAVSILDADGGLNPSPPADPG